MTSIAADRDKLTAKLGEVSATSAEGALLQLAVAFHISQGLGSYINKQDEEAAQRTIGGLLHAVRDFIESRFGVTTPDWQSECYIQARRSQ